MAEQVREARPARICASIGCGISFEGRRRHARFCSGSCRLRSKRLLPELRGELADWEARSAAFWAGMAEVRGRSRSGREKRDKTRRLAGEEP